MASLPTRPIVVIDEEEAIVIDDESEDEIEILEYGFSTLPRTPSILDASLRSTSHPSPKSNCQIEQSLDPRMRSAASVLPNHTSPMSLPCRRVHQISGIKRTHADPNDISTEIHPHKALSRSRTLSPDYPHRVSSCNMPERPTTGPKFCSSTQPIDLEENACIDATQLKHSDTSSESRRSSMYGLDPATARDRDSPEETHFEREAFTPGTLIDLDELENFDDLWNDEEELQILRVEQIKPSQCHRKPSKTPASQRNPPIVAPLVKILAWKQKNLLIRASKTVELLDGDFVLVTDIIQHQTLGEITLRGQRLQRCRSMNGLLERKLNEVCFFDEVDLDDPRPSKQQSLFEVPIGKVHGLRDLQQTNQIFPNGRNLDVEKFRTQLEATLEGGLTARWRYTCTYATIADRWHNNPKERTLKFVQEDECTKRSRISDQARRFDWRGETASGGAYRPDLEDQRRLIEGPRNDSIISLESTISEPDPDCVFINSPIASDSARSSKENAHLTSTNLPTPSLKRKASSYSAILLQDTPRKNSKKVRLKYGDEVEIEATRKKLSMLSMEERQTAPSQIPAVIDLTAYFMSSQSQRDPAAKANKIFSSTSHDLNAPKLSSMIDLSSSDLATPAVEGVIRPDSVSAHGPFTRAPGQMLTYGDAFCGAGGTTRGASMAGLRVLWGFDHWNYACATWRTNFPQAKCYELSSQQFVGRAQGSKYGKPIDMKVDILHLSPPCQYFSPAHTVDCPSDEMNVASLYAVGPVIKVAKPRVVTLEQTFGIVAVKFRKYFNSLIQMFTALSFSVRWAVVPLAQWGLPQRRYRLIVIAACPGEFLPAMPPATHADPSSDTSLPPFNTVNETLSRIPINAPDHDPSSLLFPQPKILNPWNGNTILPRAMTTSGGQNYHPSGTRDFTLREYAALQGFPENHVFKGSYVKKQIGNAVPPVVAKVLFESIRRQLDEADGVVDEGGRVVMVVD